MRNQLRSSLRHAPFSICRIQPSRERQVLLVPEPKRVRRLPRLIPESAPVRQRAGMQQEQTLRERQA
jgi:hypothetical protein